MKKRIQNAIAELEKNSLDAIIISSPHNIQYLSGVFSFPHDEQDAWILITKNEATIFTDMRYLEHVKRQASEYMDVVELSSSLSFLDAIDKLSRNYKLKNVGFESRHLTYYLLKILKSIESVTFIETENIIENLRITKDNEEIACIQNACQLTDQAFNYIVRHVESGVSEKSLAYKLENYIKRRGGDIAFPSIVAFGPHSAIPHHSPTDRTLSYSDGFILFDFGAKVNGYTSDMTRTILTGSPNKKMVEIYETTKEAQKIGIEKLQSYSTTDFRSSDVSKTVNTFLEKSGYSPVPHGLGHGIGIQVHELPILSPKGDNRLSDGNVLTVEPGIYISGLGGVRIEDTVLLEYKKATPLTKSSKELEVIKI